MPTLAPAVTVTGFYLDWSTPPSNLCQGWTSNEPAVPFTVGLGAQVTFTWQFECWNGTATYTIGSIQSVTPGFGLASSNLPVTISSTTATQIHVTLSTPTHPYYGEVNIWVLAYAN